MNIQLWRRVDYIEENWIDYVFPSSDIEGKDNVPLKSAVKVGQRLGLPFVRSLQPTVRVKVHDREQDWREIDLSQDGTGVMGISGVIWDCGLLLLDFLNCLAKSESNQQLNWKNVIDIGAGTGICGISALLLGSSHVLFTDSFLTTSLEANLDQLPDAFRQRSNSIAYTWGSSPVPNTFLYTKETNLEQFWDVIICSDLLYESKNHTALLQFLSELRYEAILFSYKKRHEDKEKLFFQHLANTHELKVVNTAFLSFQNLSRENVESGLYLIIAFKQS